MRADGLMTRRELLRLILSSALLPVCAALPAAAGREMGLEELRSRFKGRDSYAEIAARYLALHPDEGKRESLTALIFGAGLARAVPAAGIPRRLRERIMADFRGGATVDLDGWVLSRTEARLCALLSLMGD